MDACAEGGDANCLGTCQLYNVEEGRDAFQADRKAIINALTKELTLRFGKVLDHPILKAMKDEGIRPSPLASRSQHDGRVRHY